MMYQNLVQTRPFSDAERPTFYPEDCNYSISYQNEIKNEIIHKIPVNFNGKHPNKFPTFNYFNERKCPIYVHQIRTNPSVYNHYNSKLATTRKILEPVRPLNDAKHVLDKLEETYWTTWKPKKKPEKATNLRHVQKSTNFEKPIINKAPSFQEVLMSKHSLKNVDDSHNIPYGDARDSVIKYFKAKNFECNSVTDSTVFEQKSINPLLVQEGISQEIQTELHCPVVLEKTTTTTENSKLDEQKSEQLKSKIKKSHKGKKKKIKDSKFLTNKKSPDALVAESQSDEKSAFAELKDSIEVIKQKQEQSPVQEHFQQPKCIKLYRKSGSVAGYIKGGSYPLKSCLKKDERKGNFRLGPPGSPLFLTTSSFGNGKRK